jgi:uncharacterized protein with NRDE domain
VCTLILAWRVFDDAPIAAAANRDEALGRPSLPPRILGRNPIVVAPQDESAGGTWIGYNEAGLFVAITNRAMDAEGERSRGLLVRDALGCGTATDALSLVRNELADRQYAGFNLVVADATEAALLEWDGVLRTTHFDPGVHVVVNAGHNEAAPKAAHVREAIHPAPDGDVKDAPGPNDDWLDAESWFDRAKSVLRDHELEVCIHGDGYGTRSSSLVAIDAEGDGRYWFADGKPCETEYEEVALGEGDDQI